MKCVVNWIPLRIRVRSRNTQSHLKFDFLHERLWFWFWFSGIRIARGDGSEPRAYTNSISTGTKFIPLRKKRVLSYKMMNPWPRNAQKRGIVVMPKVQNKYKPEPNLGPFNVIKKCLCTRIAVIIDQSWTPITAKSAHGVVIKMLTSFFGHSSVFRFHPLFFLFVGMPPHS